MAKYYFYRFTEKKSIKKDISLEGFILKTKNKNVSKIIIIDVNLKEKIIEKEFYKKIKRLVLIISDLFSDDNVTTGDTIIVIDEVAKLKHILKTKLAKDLSEEKEKEFMKHISSLEKSIKNGLIACRNSNQYIIPEPEEIKAPKSR